MADYVLEGPKWGSAGLMTSGGTVTWAVDNSVPLNFDPIIAAAFYDWSSYANIQFQNTGDTGLADITFSLNAIDGLGGTLGYTNYNYSGSLFNSATVEFDSGEHWRASGRAILSANGINLFDLSLHEIGHALGLDHYNAAPAIMNAVLNPTVSDLTKSDIDGIHALYGERVASDVPVNVQASNTLPFSGDTNNDLLWFNTTSSQTDMWDITNGQYAASFSAGAFPSGGMSVVGVGQFFAGGASDILFQNTATGVLSDWKIAGGQWAGLFGIGSHRGSGWQVAGTGKTA